MKNIYSNYNKATIRICKLLIYLFVDEAYTFLNYVYVKDYFNVSIANNHLLNTLLISLTSNL